MIAAPSGDEDRAAGLAGEAGVDVAVVPGGESRSESVAVGLAAVDSELVVVHDAARPLVTAELVDAIVAKLASHPDAAGVIAAAPIADTVKRASEDRPEQIEGTEPRDHLWGAQTPQAFRAPALQEALGAGQAALAAATDEAMLVERAGGTVLLHPSPVQNLKVTTPADLRLAELLLSRDG